MKGKYLQIFLPITKTYLILKSLFHFSYQPPFGALNAEWNLNRLFLQIQIQFLNCTAKVRLFFVRKNNKCIFRPFYNIVSRMRRTVYTYKHFLLK